MRVKQKATMASWTDKLSEQPTTGAPTSAAADQQRSRKQVPATRPPPAAPHQHQHHAAGMPAAGSVAGKRAANAAQLSGDGASTDPPPAAKRQATAPQAAAAARGSGGSRSAADAAAADADMPDVAPPPPPAAADAPPAGLTLAQLLEQLRRQPPPSDVHAIHLAGWAQQAGVHTGAPVAVLYQHTAALLRHLEGISSSDPSKLPTLQHCVESVLQVLRMDAVSASLCADLGPGGLQQCEQQLSAAAGRYAAAPPPAPPAAAAAAQVKEEPHSEEDAAAGVGAGMALRGGDGGGGNATAAHSLDSAAKAVAVPAQAQPEPEGPPLTLERLAVLVAQQCNASAAAARSILSPLHGVAQELHGDDVQLATVEVAGLLPHLQALPAQWQSSRSLSASSAGVYASRVLQVLRVRQVAALFASEEELAQLRQQMDAARQQFEAADAAGRPRIQPLRAAKSPPAKKATATAAAPGGRGARSLGGQQPEPSHGAASPPAAAPAASGPAPCQTLGELRTAMASTYVASTVRNTMTLLRRLARELQPAGSGVANVDDDVQLAGLLSQLHTLPGRYEAALQPGAGSSSLSAKTAATYLGSVLAVLRVPGVTAHFSTRPQELAQLQEQLGAARRRFSAHKAGSPTAAPTAAAAAGQAAATAGQAAAAPAAAPPAAAARASDSQAGAGNSCATQLQRVDNATGGSQPPAVPSLVVAEGQLLRWFAPQLQANLAALRRFRDAMRSLRSAGDDDARLARFWADYEWAATLASVPDQAAVEQSAWQEAFDDLVANLAA